MEFKVDENLPVEVADLLRQVGYDAVTVFEQHLVRTGMGSQVRAELVWVSAWTLGPRRDRSDPQRDMSQAEICLGHGHREMLRPNIARSLAEEAELDPADNAVG